MKQRVLKCENRISNECTGTFTLTPSQEAFHMKNHGALPFRCPACRKVVKLLREKLPKQPEIEVKPHFTKKKKEKKVDNPMFSVGQLMEMRKVCTEK